MSGKKLSPLSASRISFIFLGIAGFSLIFADVEITTLYPWHEFKRMAFGALTPDFFSTDDLLEAILYTLSFALLGVALASILGFALSLLFRHRSVRMFCAFIRAIHELFWALIFLQIFGLTTLTGILSIMLPYTGIFAKVYSEILEEGEQAPLKAIPRNVDNVTRFFFARLPDAWPHIKSYTLYRMECGIRSSAVVGFVGLPTLGYHLESAFMQGYYSQVSAILYILFIIIASIRIWMRPKLLPLYLLGTIFVLPGWGTISWDNFVRFFTIDIVPYPLRSAETLNGETVFKTVEWIGNLLIEQALPGIINTILLTMIALAATGILTLLFFPLISSKFFRRGGRMGGHIALVIMRSTPEYVLAFIFLQFWGPSMLPAILALSIHNGAIIGHLIGHHTETLTLRQDAPKGINLYAYEILPRVYGQFLAFLFYRWEVIMRETAILGMLGISTLGFYIDSAFAEVRFDRAFLLIVITALLNITIDSISRFVRSRLP